MKIFLNILKSNKTTFNIILNRNTRNNFNTYRRTFTTTVNSNNHITDNEKIIDTDVLIVGGGVTGLSLAQALLKSEFFSENIDPNKIVLIDQPSKIKSEDFIYKTNRVPDIRVLSLTPASVRFFKSIGLWENLDEKLIRYAKGMQVWENKGSSFIHMDCRDNVDISSLLSYLPSNIITPPKINMDFICAIVEINHLIAGFQKNLKDKINIVNQSLDYENVEIENGEEYSYLKLKKENVKYRTKLLVASDGAKSIIRNKLRIQTNGYDYNETGLVCTLRGNAGSDIAYQRFLHNGILALLPLYDDLYSIVCSMPKNINENLKKLSNEDFISFINKTLHNPSEVDMSHLDRLTHTNNFSSPPIIKEMLSKRMEFPLQLQYAQEAVNKKCVLIGDACHVVHPMAGQGLNMGIADSALLANEIIASLKIGRRLNDKRMLDSYAFKTQLNTKTMIGLIEALKMIYAPTNVPFTAIRNLGLSLFNKSSYIKGLFMLSASGELIQPNTYSWEGGYDNEHEHVPS